MGAGDGEGERSCSFSGDRRRDSGARGMLGAGDAPTPFPFKEAREETLCMNLFGSCASCNHSESLRSTLISFDEAGVVRGAGKGDSSLNVSGKAA